MDELEKRKEAVLEKLKQATKNPTYIIYALLGVIITIGVYIRTRNLGIIQWQFPLDPDSFAFLRYATYIAEHGHLMTIDMLRYYPLGWSNLSEFRVLSYFIAYLYKFLHIFIPNITIQNADVIYPVICFVISMLFFFLFVKKLFGWKVGLVSTAFLAVSPAYLYRTMAGSADKEAFAMMVLFASLYFFVSAWKAKNIKTAVGLAILAGIATAITGAVWGGVLFLFLIFATFTLINTLLEQMDKKKILVYLVWFFASASLLNKLYPARYGLVSYLFGLQTAATALVLITVIIFYILSKNQKLNQQLTKLTNNKLPLSIISLLITIALGVIAILLINGPGFIIYQIKDIFIQLTEPFGTTRWSLTVAEAHLPSFTDWMGQFSQKYLLVALAGAILAFYAMINAFQKKAVPIILFTAALIAIGISRYSPTSILNGSNTLSLLVYFGGLLALMAIFVFPYFYFYNKDKNAFCLLQKIDKNVLFALVLLLYLMISAKTAIRLLFIFAPATTIFAGYFAVNSLKKIRLLQNDTYKIVGCIAIIALISIIWVAATQASLNQATYTGSSYTFQWQQAMNWVKENTPQDAVFAHWWDYGYYVQTGGERATISDGGNSRGAINYFTGRHLLTGQSETEALELLKANNVTHLLIVYEEIGKYPAFSSIGSDKNYDRYSWITTFQLDPNMMQETRNETILVYSGATSLDEDFIYQDNIYPGGSAGIGAIIMPITQETINEGNETKVLQQMKQPSIVLFYQGQQARVPLECVFLDGKEVLFPEPGYGGCLRIIPSVDGNNQVNQIGAGLLLSPKVRRTVFTKLFLYDQPSEYFKKAYTDEDKGMPLVVYQGRLIGPLKIWNVTYPENLNIPPEYYGTEEPEEVIKVGMKFE